MSLQGLDPTGSNFTKTIHTTFNDTTDPWKVKLPTPFTVCVIGASRGIGASIACAYVAAKASTLILAARSIDQLESVAHDVRKINPAVELHVVACDIASESSVSDLARRVKQDVGRLDVVICNSGFAGPLITRVTEGIPADFERNFAVNAIGTYLVAHHLVPLLLSTSGGSKAFIPVSAAAAWITEGDIANTAYCTSKLAQLRLVEYIATQYREAGLLAVAVHPGAVRTAMAETAPAEFVPCKQVLLPMKWKQIDSITRLLKLNHGRSCGRRCPMWCLLCLADQSQRFQHVAQRAFSFCQVGCRRAGGHGRSYCRKRPS